MAEEFVTESPIFVSSLDQAGNVRDRATSITRKFHHADHRLERRERIGSDLGLGMGKLAKQRGFPGIGKSDQSGIGDPAEFQIEDRLLAGSAERVFDRSAIGGGLEIPVARPGFATLAEDEFLADFREVGDGLQIDAFITALELDRFLHGHRIAAVDHRPRGHFPDDSLAALPGLPAAGAVFTIFGDELGIVVIRAEIVRGCVDD